MLRSEGTGDEATVRESVEHGLIARDILAIAAEQPLIDADCGVPAGRCSIQHVVDRVTPGNDEKLVDVEERDPSDMDTQ